MHAWGDGVGKWAASPAFGSSIDSGLYQSQTRLWSGLAAVTSSKWNAPPASSSPHPFRSRCRLVDVDMNKGTVLHPYVWSLGAFWPGLQARGRGAGGGLGSGRRRGRHMHLAHLHSGAYVHPAYLHLAAR